MSATRTHESTIPPGYERLPTVGSALFTEGSA